MDPDLGRMQTEFYRLLLHKFALQRANRARKRRHGNEAGSKNLSIAPRLPWYIFLDCLCTLCDAESGGTTTTSIAVEQAKFRIVFWIAMNDRANTEMLSMAGSPTLQGAKDLVQRTLQALAGLREHPGSSGTTQLAIFRDSVQFCRKRVAHYRGYTLKFVTIIQKDGLDSAELERLIEQISELFHKENDDWTICKDAYDFCRSEAGSLLRNNATTTSLAWRYLRHNVGRLGCWYKATKYLVNAAPSFADVLANSSVDLVPPSNTLPGEVSFARDLQDLFSGNGAKDYDFSRSRMNQVFGTDATDRAEKDLLTFVKSPARLRLHAEVRMADFFHVSRRSYFRNIHYIGCSKGSCYCCDLYLSLHPSDIVRRPCHGNVWVKWQTSDVMSAKETGPTLLERMVSRMRDDIRRDVMDQGHRGDTMTFDSSTGIVSFEDPIQTSDAFKLGVDQAIGRCQPPGNSEHH